MNSLEAVTNEERAVRQGPGEHQGGAEPGPVAELAALSLSAYLGDKEVESGKTSELIKIHALKPFQGGCTKRVQVEFKEAGEGEGRGGPGRTGRRGTEFQGWGPGAGLVGLSWDCAHEQG